MPISRLATRLISSLSCRSPRITQPLFMSSASLPRDVLAFIQDYPEQRQRGSETDNLQFYQNSLRSRPDDLLIEEMHEQWKGNYELLERLHGYIQWWFPIQEHGMNWESAPLQRGEIDSIREDAAIRARFMESYRLILDFFGMELADEETGRLQRNQGNYQQRYRNLNRSSHNYLRISRIMKSLTEFGYPNFPAAFCLFVLSEQSENQQLTSGTLISSMDRWWINCNRNEKGRKAVNDLVSRVRSGQTFTYKAYEELLDKRHNGDTNWAKL